MGPVGQYNGKQKLMSSKSPRRVGPWSRTDTVANRDHEVLQKSKPPSYLMSQRPCASPIPEQLPPEKKAAPGTLQLAEALS